MAYVVDIISDGEQVFDSGIISRADALTTYGERVANTLAASQEAGATGREYTVRMIRNGDILAEATACDGDILASYISPALG